MNMSALLKELANVENPAAPKVADDVQSSISKTLASLAESAKKLDEQVSSGAGADSDALLEKVLEQFNSNTEFQNMMENMVQQIMSKDIMYGPLKEMKEKVGVFFFPPPFKPYVRWLVPFIHDRHHQYSTRIGFKRMGPL